VLYRFYDTGYEDGNAHGRIHGLIEGRALGREKGFEMWEELGFYEGFAMMWQAIYLKQNRTDDRALHHIKHLLELISQFPRTNPSDTASEADSSTDIPKLLRQIRSRYKALCSTLGVRASLRAAGDEEDEHGSGGGVNSASNRQVWKLESDTKRPVDQRLSF